MMFIKLNYANIVQLCRSRSTQNTINAKLFKSENAAKKIQRVMKVGREISTASHSVDGMFMRCVFKAQLRAAGAVYRERE